MEKKYKLLDETDIPPSSLTEDEDESDTDHVGNLSNVNTVTSQQCNNKKESYRAMTSTPLPSGSTSKTTTGQPNFPIGKLFKKCKSATFQIDGATYTIGESINFITYFEDMPFSLTHLTQNGRNCRKANVQNISNLEPVKTQDWKIIQQLLDHVIKVNECCGFVKGGDSKL